MPRLSLNLSDKTARRFREAALKETGSMKGLSQVGEEAIKEYLEGRYPKKTTFVIRRKSKEVGQVPDVVQEMPSESAQIQ